MEEMQMPQPDADTVSLIAQVCEFIRADPDRRITLAVLGKETGLSPAHLQRTFKRVVGVSPRQFADACRLTRLKSGLKEGESVTTAMFAAGYGSSSRLYEKAGGQLGMTPGEYRQGGARATIRYTTSACDFGRVLLAVTARGVCAVALASTDAELERFLTAEFPAAELTRDDAGLAGWLGELQQQLAGGPHADLPLDVRATAFQRRVWEELRKIPRGETRTYRQVAEAIGAPTAARAVARACATNPASLVIPCHRVIGSDGGLHGYRWGMKRKKKLLEEERKKS
jgi:AraC family transcriptional regulator, regulatory protein of adaptative response / methylated-DNA-[protein]-cysteine methyltransferase